MTFKLEDEKLIIRHSNIKDLGYIKREEEVAANEGFVALWADEQHIDAFNNDNILHLIVEEKESRLPVGYLIINGVENLNDSLELMRIVVSKKHCGYGRRTIDIVKKLAFSQLLAHRLWLDVRIHNTYAHNLYTDIGFREEGILRECVKINEKYVSIVIMSILKSEYLNHND